MANFELNLLDKVIPLLKQHSEVIIPPGDDCAGVVFDEQNLLLLASDQIIGNVHYFEKNCNYAEVGAKLLKRNLSDIAAMGGVANYALLNIAQSGLSIADLELFFAGIERTAERYNISIVGGDVGSFLTAKIENDSNLQNSHLIGSLAIVGKVARDIVCLRKNAQVGDVIFVTGKLGDTLESNHHLTFEPRLQEGRFLAVNRWTKCMMDISDGLILDLKRICKASAVSAKINLKDLPLRNLSLDYKQIFAGEDYELLFTVKKSLAKELMAKWDGDKFAPISPIGEIIEKNENCEILDYDGNKLDIGNIGYEH